MRIVAWNIRAGGGGRVGRIGRQLARWKPDVVALSEFRATPPSLALATVLAGGGLTHQLTTADTSQPGRNALLVAARWPLRRLRLPAQPSEPGRWLVTAVQGPMPMVLGAMHVPNRGTGRKYPFLDAALLAHLKEAAYVWGAAASRGRRSALSDHAALLVDIAET